MIESGHGISDCHVVSDGWRWEVRDNLYKQRTDHVRIERALEAVEV